MSERLAGPLPEDHDCEECDCPSPESGYHHDSGGYCLACGGCGDWECVAHCDFGAHCHFEERTQVPA